MKIYRAKTGPFKERPFYTDDEIESICIEGLQGVGLYPTSPQPVRIDRFVEKRFGICPQYDDLPGGLLGFTKFGPKGAEEIVVSKLLADDGSKTAERRINTTLAHEAGHALLHAHLFALEWNDNNYSLFKDNVDRNQQKILCRTGDDAESIHQNGKPAGYDGRWWEYQANRMIGALLLPRTLIYEALTPFLEKQGVLGAIRLNYSKQNEAIASVVDIFDVNPIVAQIRIGEIFPASKTNQLTL